VRDIAQVASVTNVGVGVIIVCGTPLDAICWEKSSNHRVLFTPSSWQRGEGWQDDWSVELVGDATVLDAAKYLANLLSGDFTDCFVKQ
jgi:hypothetical protein